MGRRIQWPAFGQDETNRLRSSSESNKTALEIVLQVGTITFLAQQKQRLTHTSSNTGVILQRMDTIVAAAASIEQKLDAHSEAMVHELAQLRAHSA